MVFLRRDRNTFAVWNISPPPRKDGQLQEHFTKLMTKKFTITCIDIVLVTPLGPHKLGLLSALLKMFNGEMCLNGESLVNCYAVRIACHLSIALHDLISAAKMATFSKLNSTTHLHFTAFIFISKSPLHNLER